MSNQLFLSNLIDGIGNNAALEERDTLVPVSVRLTEKNAAMLEVFAELNQGKAPLHIFPGQLSQAIADTLLSDKAYADMLNKMFADGKFKDDSSMRGALNLLILCGAVGFGSDFDPETEFGPD